jgi:hypothetical protein
MHAAMQKVELKFGGIRRTARAMEPVRYHRAGSRMLAAP